jgi:short subunit dehydrogenase-like uncharacterized protein
MATAKQTSWMIYGANGFTGTLAAKVAVARGERPILAGRNAEALDKLGRELDLPVRVFDLSSAEMAARELSDVGVVLCCAGPFKRTAEQMLAACEISGTHYVDITGELDVFEWVHARSERWQKAGIVALPGAGFDVVPSDCLAAMLKRDQPDATRLRIGFKSSHGKMGPGTGKTMYDALIHGARVRRKGSVVSMPSDEMVARFRFEGAREEPAVGVSWGDVSTAYYSTGIPDIECFIGLPANAIDGVKRMPKAKKLLGHPLVQRQVEKLIERFVKGPSEEERRTGHMFLVGEAEGPNGRAKKRMVLPDGSIFTAEAAVEISLRVLAGEVAPGAQTPSMAFGPDFVTTLKNVRVEALPA